MLDGPGCQVKAQGVEKILERFVHAEVVERLDNQVADFNRNSRIDRDHVGRPELKGQAAAHMDKLGQVHDGLTHGSAYQEFPFEVDINGFAAGLKFKPFWVELPVTVQVRCFRREARGKINHGAAEGFNPFDPLGPEIDRHGHFVGFQGDVRQAHHGHPVGGCLQRVKLGEESLQTGKGAERRLHHDKAEIQVLHRQSDRFGVHDGIAVFVRQMVRPVEADKAVDIGCPKVEGGDLYTLDHRQVIQPQGKVLDRPRQKVAKSIGRSHKITGKVCGHVDGGRRPLFKGEVPAQEHEIGQLKDPIGQPRPDQFPAESHHHTALRACVYGEFIPREVHHHPVAVEGGDVVGIVDLQDNVLDPDGNPGYAVQGHAVGRPLQGEVFVGGGALVLHDNEAEAQIVHHQADRIGVVIVIEIAIPVAVREMVRPDARKRSDTGGRNGKDRDIGIVGRAVGELYAPRRHKHESHRALNEDKIVNFEEHGGCDLEQLVGEVQIDVIVRPRSRLDPGLVVAVAVQVACGKIHHPVAVVAAVDLDRHVADLKFEDPLQNVEAQHIRCGN